MRLVDRAGDVMVMERAWPGEPLSGLVFAGRDDEATEAVCGVIRALQRAPAPGGFRTLEDWGEGFDRVRRKALAEGADAETIDLARKLQAVLCASQGERLLLHGDLHHDNILKDEARGWLAIDPRAWSASSPSHGDPGWATGAGPGAHPGLVLRQGSAFGALVRGGWLECGACVADGGGDSAAPPAPGG